MIWRSLIQLHRDLVARVSRYLAIRQVIETLRVAHAQELAVTPGEQWGLVRQQHAEQIQAVRDGKLDVVDRRSWAWPYLPEALHRLNQPILKSTPYNIRRFSETPIARRAINVVKNTVVSLEWRISVAQDVEENSEREKRIRIATDCLRRPNNVDSFRTLMEAVVEDVVIGGYGVIEPRLTPYYKRPFKLWPVDGSTIRLYADWTESTPDRPRYAQQTGLKGERGIVPFLSDELIYIKDNPRSSTPFGLGKLEVAFNSVNAFLGAQDSAAKAGSDQVHKTWLWWKIPVPNGQLQTINRHIRNELEGQQKISIMSGMPKPDVIDVQPVTPQDLLLEWQEFLIRIIAAAFDLSPLALGVERDVNRNTGEVMATADFRQAIYPLARRVEEALTRDLFQGLLHWTDIQFEYIGLDDPDTQTQIAIYQRMYLMDSITPDEIREDTGRSPLPGGWGKLTNFQKQLVLLSAQAKIRGGGSGGVGMPPGMGIPSPGGFQPGGGSRPPSLGPWTGERQGGFGASQRMGGADLGMAFGTDDVSQMSPEDIAQYQDAGLLPGTNQLARQMEDEQPGILETLSEELQDFFKLAQKLDKKSTTQPEKVTQADEARQQRRFARSEHSPAVLEQMYQDRGMEKSREASVNPVRQPKVRGKYPRSGSRRGWYR